MSKAKVLSWGIFILLALVWGSSFILMKKSAEHLSGWQIGATRIVSAGLAFLPFAIFHFSKIPANKLGLVILSGVFGNLIPAFLFAIAIDEKIDSSLAGILNSLTPLFVIAIGILFFKVKIQNKKIAGVIVGFIGLFLLSISRGPITMSAFGFTLLILLATIFYAINVNMISIYLKGINPIHMATVSIAFILIPAAFILWHQQVIPAALQSKEAMEGVILVSILGVAGTAISTALFYVLIKRAGALFASLVTYAIPVVAIFWGIIAKEDIGVIQISCLSVILAGVYLANK